MRKDRLLKLADYLDTVKPRKFDMGMWGVRGSVAGIPCGFKGCALGWAGHSRLFRGMSFKDGIVSYTPPNANTIRGGYPAAAAVFEIPYSDAQYLFGSAHAGELPGQVAKQIRSYVEAHA